MKFVKMRWVVCAVAMCVACAWADKIKGIDFAPVGNPSNPADPHGDSDRNGFGSVDYVYRISQKEITIAQFQASGIPDSNFDWWNDGTDSTRMVGPNAPVVRILWHQAARYCNWLTSGDDTVGAYTIDGDDKVTGVMSRADILATGELYFVLPTDDEWYKAAFYLGSGNNYSRYANGTGDAPAIGLGGAMYDTNTVWQVGSGLLEANHNTYDLMGNVFEWTQTPRDGSALTSGSVITNDMTLRGGAYAFGVEFLDADTRLQEDPNKSSAAIGIRVVAIPEPGTMSLMGLSTVSLFATRSIRRRKRLGQSLLPVRQEHLCDRFDALDAELAMSEEATEAPVWVDTVMEYIMMSGQKIYDGYKQLDKEIWNRIVATHERRLARRTAVRATLKRKALNAFDAFLERIMK